MGTILYGSEMAKDIRTSLKEQIDELRRQLKRFRSRTRKKKY